jgi:hypothetical protein
MWSLAAAYVTPTWLQEFHTFCAAAGDLLQPIAIFFGIIATWTAVQRNRAERKEENLEILHLQAATARHVGVGENEIHAAAPALGQPSSSQDSHADGAPGALH